MTRDTDRQIIDHMRQINMELVEISSAQIDLVVSLGSALAAAGIGGENTAMISAAVEDMAISLRDLNDRMKEVFELQAENIRLTMHGAP